MQNTTVHILWDNSRLWGVMAFRAMRALGVECRLVKAKEIAQGSLMRKQPALLLAPGGGARAKAAALGEEGREAIRAWLAAGGKYLGFCGGAGLALAQDNPAHGLGICPWHRHAYQERLYHLISGHVLAEGPDGAMRLPVWWPGRFGEEARGPRPLARFIAAAEDLWLADLPLMAIPEAALRAWRPNPHDLDLPAGQPLAIAGEYGAGAYILSYAHLETPASAQANAWLARILAEAGANPAETHVPQWRVEPQQAGAREDLAEVFQRVWELARKIEAAGFLFRRAPWLFGWRNTMPGMAVNHLLACLWLLGKMAENGREPPLWRARRGEFMSLMQAFLERAEVFFWHARLCRTLQSFGADMARPQAGRDVVFGHAMLGGGMLEPILALLEDFIYEWQEP